jgi:hypothetical protein
LQYSPELQHQQPPSVSNNALKDQEGE